MKRFNIAAISMIFAVLLTGSCGKHETEYNGEYSSVLIYCSLGYNNLSSYMKQNLADLCGGILPEKSRDKAIVAFCHNTASGSDFTTPNPPVLVRIYRDRGQAVIDTLRTYPEIGVSSSAETLRQVMLDIADLYPSKNYGMLFSSHATGWIPPGYTVNTERGAAAVQEECDMKEYLPTKSVGAQYVRTSGNSIEMDLKDFAEAIPMTLDYMIFDACLMGGIEVAWELKDVCRKLMVSPAEILAGGLEYSTMSWNLFSGREPDLVSVARDFMDKYCKIAEETGDSRYLSATATVVDCTMIEPVGDAFAAIVESHRDGLEALDRNSVQGYFYDRKSWYYDLRDLASGMGADSMELAALDAALDGCILFHGETPTFFGVPLERCCGLSINIPDRTRPLLYSYYRTLSWNAYTGFAE